MDPFMPQAEPVFIAIEKTAMKKKVAFLRDPLSASDPLSVAPSARSSPPQADGREKKTEPRGQRPLLHDCKKKIVLSCSRGCFFS
jgi:hypothetical protein